ncbi:MAG: hypothetical protein QF893_19640, partial [Alphaproteobacteria bacterium]|nr:hypothetical protein [Alphaproteobacteria bacterium]
MAFDLIKFFYREAPVKKRMLLASSFTAGFSRGLLLTVINGAAAQASDGDVDALYFMAFVALLAVYLGCRYYSTSRVAQAA